MPPNSTPSALSVQAGENAVIAAMPAAGPIMNVASIEMVSREYAARSSPAGTSAARTCRASEPAGTESIPAGTATAASASYGRCGAAIQNAVVPIPQTATIGRSPYLSKQRPSSGAPRAIPRVTPAPTSPAAP